MIFNTEDAEIAELSGMGSLFSAVKTPIFDSFNRKERKDHKESSPCSLRSSAPSAGKSSLFPSALSVLCELGVKDGFHKV